MLFIFLFFRIFFRLISGITGSQDTVDDLHGIEQYRKDHSCRKGTAEERLCHGASGIGQDQTGKIKTKQNDDADPGKDLTDAFEIFHFEPFYIELRKKNINAVFIAEPWETNTSGKWFDYDSAIKILDEKGYVYHKFVNVNCKCAITTQQKDILKKYTNAKKIQLIYGIGFLKKVQFQLKDFLKDPFDYYFVNGGYYKDKFLKLGGSIYNIIDVSYPKHRDFFKRGYEKQKLIKELGIHTDKPILLYYPTWDEYSSIKEFADRIDELRNDFFVVTKPHHCTFRLKSKKNDLKKLYDVSDMVLDGNYDFAKTTILADLAICDSKSASST